MTALHLAAPKDAPKLLGLMAAFHAEEGLDLDDAHRARAVQPVLEGSPYGQIFLVGPRMAPIGYLAVTFSWSIEFGGLDAFVDELYLRPSVRGRGLGSEILVAASQYLTQKQVMALHLEVDHSNEPAIALYTKLGFQHRARYGLMSLRLG